MVSKNSLKAARVREPDQGWVSTAAKGSRGEAAAGAVSAAAGGATGVPCSAACTAGLAKTAARKAEVLGNSPRSLGAREGLGGIEEGQKLGDGSGVGGNAAAGGRTGGGCSGALVPLAAALCAITCWAAGLVALPEGRRPVRHARRQALPERPAGATVHHGKARARGHAFPPLPLKRVKPSATPLPALILSRQAPRLKPSS